MTTDFEPRWHTSSHSSGGNQCVEVAGLPGGAAMVRDSTDRGGPVLLFGAGKWTAFLAAARRGASG